MISGRTVAVPRRTSVVTKASWTKVGTRDALKSAGRMVVEVNGSKILVVEDKGEVFAVSNKCSHLGLPLQGKVLSAPVANGCVTCAAHNTSFDLKTGAVVGEWCPKMPALPVIGKIGGNEKKPLPVYQVRVNEDGSIEVNA